jgi:hypothetical protein
MFRGKKTEKGHPLDILLARLGLSVRACSKTEFPPASPRFGSEIRVATSVFYSTTLLRKWPRIKTLKKAREKIARIYISER